MQNHWFVVLPPILVVLLAFITRRVLFSLALGIFSAALIAHDFNIIRVFPAIGSRILSILEFDKLTSYISFWSCTNLFLCLFLLILTFIIVMIQASGGGYAYGAFIMTKLKSIKKAECATLTMSLFFFIDDYFSSLTVGSVMQPITDQFKIPRVKLAFLVNSVAAPLAVLFPLTTWMAEIVGQFRNSGIASVITEKTLIAADPFWVYTHMIPFLFYSLIVLASLWFMVLGRLSFGIVAEHEALARKTGEIFGGKSPVVRRMSEISDEQKKSSSIGDFVFPMVVLLGVIGLAMLYFGDYTLFGGQNDCMSAIQKANIFAALFMGSLISAFVCLLFFIARKKIVISQVYSMAQEALALMGGAIMVLVLIWTLSSLLKDDLATGQYLAQKLIGYIDIAYFPLVFFLVAVCTSAMMGSAWGTIGMLVPLGIPMLVSFMHLTPPVILADISMLLPLLGAIISGALVGNHVSPVADVMLMSATSSGAYHMDLVKAQIGFTIPTIISTSLAFFLTGRLLPLYGIAKTAGISLAAGIGLNFVILFVLHVINRVSTRS